MDQLIYIVTHIQDVILILINWLGPWSYLVLFTMTFMETGLVIFPWLPGESLIFVTSALAALPNSHLQIGLLIVTFFIAAGLGDIVNYKIGTSLMNWQFFRKRIVGPNLERAEAFFKRHGGKAVIFGRFVPVIRTFVPLISGTSNYPFSKFIGANVIGVALWVGIASILGYFFGTIPVVKNRLSLFIVGVVFVAAVPAIVIYIIKLIRKHIINRNFE